MASLEAGPAGAERLTHLDAAAVARWAVELRGALAAHRTEIDALNFFPVPDADTGTNLYLTLDAALDRVRGDLDLDRSGDARPSLVDLAGRLAHAILFTARGNSGVILSQIFRGLSEEIGETGADRLDGPALARVLQRADSLAWACVTHPVEGTMLSVTRAGARAAAGAVDAGRESLLEIAGAALAAAREALARTPSQLPQLAQAGVVDAGGAGCVVMLETLYRIVAGRSGDATTRPGLWDRHAGWSHAGAPGPQPVAHPPPPGPAFEVMYLLSDSGEEQTTALRQRLVQLGDSVLVVGSGATWTVHVHTDDAGAAVEAGLCAGRCHRIRITHFGEERAAGACPEPRAVGVVACAAGAGLARVFRAAGAVVAGAPAGCATPGQLLEAIRATGAGCVLVLPNDTDTVAAAEAAAEAAGGDAIEVRVLPAGTAVQGIAALAVFDPATGLAGNVAAMTTAAGATRHAAVLLAAQDATTPGEARRRGDVLGMLDGEVAVVGSSVHEVARQVLETLLASGGELLTVITGAEAPADLADAVDTRARSTRPDLEITHIAGDQPGSLLLLGME